MTDLLGVIAESKRKYPNYPGARDCDTSIAAAEKIAPKQSKLQRRALEIIDMLGGATTEQIERMAPMSYTTASARCSELQALGLIRDSGRRALNSRKNKVRVWERANGK